MDKVEGLPLTRSCLVPITGQDSVMNRLNRVVVAAVLAAGVVVTSAGGVVEAKPKPAPGRVCTMVGRVVLLPVPLVCRQTPNNGLRWRKAPTTTTTSTSTSKTVVVPLVSLSPTFITGGTFPKAVVVTSNVAGTVYFAEGAFPIKKLSDITSADANRWASGVVYAGVATSVPIDVTAVLNGYYRVYVSNAEGLLSAPATDIVTISITRASTVAVTTTPVALTCATGGTCAVGETGPGGGVVFYVSASNFTSIGSACNTACKYLEAAPANTDGDPTRSWATDVNSNRTTAVTGADGTAIGTGYQNTLDIVAQTGNVAATSAAVEARAYRGPNNLTDWHLPSKAEINQMCKWQGGLDWISDATVCTGGVSNSGRGASGFSTGYYWSSSEAAGNLAWDQLFADGSQSSYFKGINSDAVRPVRAFGGTVACVDGGACAVGDTGPGGGVVFYVAASNFTSTGSTCNTACKYLEAALTDQSTGIVWATADEMCYNTDDSNNGNCQTTSVYSGISTVRDSSRAASQAIGMGMANTENFAGRLAGYPQNSTNFAAGIAWTHESNGKTDWHLPSKGELNELFLERARVGGFTTGDYWSSSERNEDTPWLQRFTDGSQSYNAKGDPGYVRLVRAFG